MIHVIGNEENIIHYECDCGMKGFCNVKPHHTDAAIMIDVTCPNCKMVERLILLQYSSEENRKKLLDNLNDAELVWSSINDDPEIGKEE